MNYTPNDVIQQLETWLGTLHTTLWLDWDITDPKQRRKAAEYMWHKVFVPFNDFLDEQHDEKLATKAQAQYDFDQEYGHK